MTCPATVQQTSDTFVNGTRTHVHGPEGGIQTTLAVKAKMKETAKTDVFQPASAIVEGVIIDDLDVQQTSDALPGPSSLARMANRVRAKLRPAEPRDLLFEIAENFIPADFLRADVRVNTHRHIVFATERQLTLLVNARRWYLDGTFKVVKDPFVQLFSIHAFLRHDDATKQVPLAFVFMSRRKSKDYRAVFRAIDDLLPQRAAVLEFVADFETGMWKGIREVYPGLPIKGCCFHWNQAVWRKVQELGLAQQYLNDDGTCKFIKKIFALPFLPAEHVEAAFDGLRRATQVPGLVTLLDYVDRTWMRSSVWSVDAWSVFNQCVRTNNDVEGCITD
ncbi:uncharacterized protein LOC121369182 isoform X2 [Gigantopelta aegis]|nr:uncharacterized protein LOC121369182 isoform X2 [Gigantopelta aegis]